MNTATATYVNTDGTFRGKARALLAILRRALETTGRAHLSGMRRL